MNTVKLEYTINNENRFSLCDEISEEIINFCKNLKYPSREIARYRLTVEECLLNWLDTNPIGEKIVFTCGKRFNFIPFIDIQFTGNQFNPFYPDETANGNFEKSTLVSLNLSPTYSYENLKNNLHFTLKKIPQKQIYTLMWVITFAILTGFCGKLLIPDTIINIILENIIAPVYSTFFHILNCIAGPMIFLSVAWGIYGIGDAATFSRIGKNMMNTYILTVTTATIFAAFTFPLMGLNFSSSLSTGSQFKTIFEMMLDFFPPNIMEPFKNGNTIQIIVMAFAMGIALLFLSKKTEFVAKNIEQFNYLVQFLMELISKIVPSFIFIVIVNLFWSNTFDIISTTSKMLCIHICLIIIICTTFYIFTGIKLKASPAMLIKKCFPILLVALSTASSAATFTSQVEVCDKRLGINNSISSFGIPLGMVLLKPFTAISYLLLAYFFADYYSIQCSLSWVITAIFVCSVMAMATPPIPGGAVAAYVVIYMQLGIPQDALMVTLAIDIITDIINTGANMFVLPMLLTNISYNMGMIDKKVIQNKI